MLLPTLTTCATCDGRGCPDCFTNPPIPMKNRLIGIAAKTPCPVCGNLFSIICSVCEPIPLYSRTANVDERGDIIPPSVVSVNMKTPTIKPTQGNYTMSPEFEKAWNEHLKLTREIRDLLAQSVVKKPSHSESLTTISFDNLVVRKAKGQLVISHPAIDTTLDEVEREKLRAFLCG